MNANEWAGLGFVVTIIVVLSIITVGISNGVGYESGYRDGKEGKKRYETPYINPYPNTMGSLPKDGTFPVCMEDDDYLLNSSDKINKGGNEHGNQSKGYKSQDDRDAEDADAYLQPDKGDEQKSRKDVQNLGWIFQGILSAVAIVR